MAKLLRLRDHILIGAGFASEAFEEVRLVGGLWPWALKGRYGFVPSRYKRNSYLTTVSNLLSTGEIAKTTNNKGEVFLELTSSGEKNFVRRFSLFSLEKKPWDERYMIVIFDIPEKQKKTRDRLRAKLDELGFGMLQESVWISPYHFEEDMREFLINSGLGSFVMVLTAKDLLSRDPQNLAIRVWGLEKVNRGYKRVLKILAKIKNEKSGKHSFKRACAIYLDTLAQDPLLPKELLPAHWSRERALTQLNRQSKLLKSRE